MNDASGESLTGEPRQPGFRLKPREFAVDNPPASSAARDEVTDVRQHFALAQAKTPRARPAPPATNEVHAILRDNVAHATAAGQNDAKPVRRRASRRLRDYLILSLGSTLLAAAVTWLFHASLITLALWVFLNVGLAWIMWGVMDDY